MKDLPYQATVARADETVGRLIREGRDSKAALSMVLEVILEESDPLAMGGRFNEARCIERLQRLPD